MYHFALQEAITLTEENLQLEKNVIDHNTVHDGVKKSP